MSFFVTVTPHPIRMNSSSVLPSVRQNADLACIFEGFPDIVTWTKDGHSLQGGSKYIIPTLVYSIKDGTTTSTLRVNKVVSTDFGTYTCNATNKFGSNSITGKLESECFILGLSFTMYKCLNIYCLKALG